MNRVTALLLGLALVVGVSGKALAEGGENDFTLVNKTGYTISKVYVSPHDKNTWGEDIMGKDELAEGGSVDIKFHPAADADDWDLKVVYSDKEEAVWADLHLPKIHKITIHWSDKKSTTADIE